MLRATNSPIFRSTCDYIQHRYCCRPVRSQPCHRSAAISVQCTKSCLYSQKCSWRWASLSPETCRADSNRSIKISIKESCCISLVAYIVVLMTHFLTNVKNLYFLLVCVIFVIACRQQCQCGERSKLFEIDFLKFDLVARNQKAVDCEWENNKSERERGLYDRSASRLGVLSGANI